MRGLAWHVWILLLVMGQVKLSGQGTLQFNKAMILTSDSGQKTVPANKVWKVESYSFSQTLFYNAFGNYGNINWSNSNQNPCTGATSGSSTINFFLMSSCPTLNSGLLVNGFKVHAATYNAMPIWMPEGSSLLVYSIPCFNTVSFSVPSNTAVRDNSNGSVLCGPINVTAGAVPNSPVVSILEFNIIP